MSRRRRPLGLMVAALAVLVCLVAGCGFARRARRPGPVRAGRCRPAPPPPNGASPDRHRRLRPRRSGVRRHGAGCDGLVGGRRGPPGAAGGRRGWFERRPAAAVGGGSPLPQVRWAVPAPPGERPRRPALHPVRRGETVRRRRKGPGRVFRRRRGARAGARPPPSGAPKGEIRLGSVGAESGVIGAAMAPIAEGARALGGRRHAGARGIRRLSRSRRRIRAASAAIVNVAGHVQARTPLTHAHTMEAFVNYVDREACPRHRGLPPARRDRQQPHDLPGEFARGGAAGRPRDGGHRRSDHAGLAPPNRAGSHPWGRRSAGDGPRPGHPSAAERPGRGLSCAGDGFAPADGVAAPDAVALPGGAGTAHRT